jgi:hypothetical protein
MVADEDGQKVRVDYDPPHPACRFVAYRSSRDGALGWLRLLSRRAHWWRGVHSETASGLVEGLTTPPAYFTADPAAYEDAVARHRLTLSHLARGSAPSGGSLTRALAFAAGLFGLGKAFR